MKRLCFALLLCSALFFVEFSLVVPTTSAGTDIAVTLLDLPAPPPPNPFVPRPDKHPETFYKNYDPPPDNAPIEDLMDYWEHQSGITANLNYRPVPSEIVVTRIVSELRLHPERTVAFVEILPATRETVDFVKETYDLDDVLPRPVRSSLRSWLLYNSKHFIDDLSVIAGRVGASGDYVSNHDQLLALTRVDFDRAKPLIDRLASDTGGKATTVLAKWALYRHALDTDNLSDINRYRSELQSVVEDREATDGMRDLALDALLKEKEWSGRDNWYFSLMGDETLADLRVNGSHYTGLTTLMYYSPDNKYVEKMIALVGSSNPTIRAAAAQNLAVKIGTGDPAIIKALVPWLEDPNWAKDTSNFRQKLLDQLSNVYVPESVPGLIKMLDETDKDPVSADPPPGKAGSSDVKRITSSGAGSVSTVGRVSSGSRAGSDVKYPFRLGAVKALEHQHSPLANGPLRRVLAVTGYSWASEVISALVSCGGFSIAEQLSAIENDARENVELSREKAVGTGSGTVVLGDADVVSDSDERRPPEPPVNAAQIRSMLSVELTSRRDVSPELARAIVKRIGEADKSDRELADEYRASIVNWKDSSVSILFLSDIATGRASVETVIRMLARRDELRTKYPQDIIYNAPDELGSGIAACLAETDDQYSAVLSGNSVRAKIGLLACARLIRAPLNVGDVVPLLRSNDKMLALAADRFLESEDSPRARDAVLALHKGEALILGAQFMFDPTKDETSLTPEMKDLLESVKSGLSAEFDESVIVIDKITKNETELIKEVKSDDTLQGIYSYDDNFVRVRKDRVMFSWFEDGDDARYHERQLEAAEFESLKTYLHEQRADELPPFLNCVNSFCPQKELLMIGRNGGRRVFAISTGSAFFVGLDKIFESLKATPSPLKYKLSREMPGLEILDANPDLPAFAVCGEGGEIKAIVADRIEQKRVVDNIQETIRLNESTGGQTREAISEMARKLYKEHGLDGVSWRKIGPGLGAEPVSQPTTCPVVPENDSPHPPFSDHWKRTVGDWELRTLPGRGLVRIKGGREEKISDDNWADVLTTENGKWAVGLSYSDGKEDLAILNLTSGAVRRISGDHSARYYPVAYLNAIDRFLLVDKYRTLNRDSSAPQLPTSLPAADAMKLLDPGSGKLEPAYGQMGVFAAMSFRPLQKTGTANQVWAAVPNEENSSTAIGKLDTSTFKFTKVLEVPKIKFGSMAMWVDEPGNKVYFIYKSQLLSLPLKK